VVVVVVIVVVVVVVILVVEVVVEVEVEVVEEGTRLRESCVFCVGPLGGAPFR